MNKKVAAILAIIIIVGIVIFVSLGTKGQDQIRTIKIGAVLPMSGTQAYFGEGMKDALELAKKNLGNTKYKYDLVVEDGAFDVKTSVSAANKLINIDKVDVIIDAYAPIGDAISPITEKAQVVHIGVAFDPKMAEGDYNFILFTTPDTAAKSFLSEMQKRGLHTLGIFRVNNQGISAVNSAITSLASQYGITVVSNEMFQPGERDFKSVIAKNASARPDIYALLALSPEIEILTKQMRDQNIQNISSTIYFELAKDKAPFEGLWSIGYGKVSSDFESQYKTAYNRELGFGAANVYDAFNAIVQASELNTAINRPTTQFIAKSLQGMSDFDGVLGKLHIDSAGIIDTPTMVKIVKDGKLIAQ